MKVLCTGAGALLGQGMLRSLLAMADAADHRRLSIPARSRPACTGRRTAT